MRSCGCVMPCRPALRDVGHATPNKRYALSTLPLYGNSIMPPVKCGYTINSAAVDHGPGY